MQVCVQSVAESHLHLQEGGLGEGEEGQDAPHQVSLSAGVSLLSLQSTLYIVQVYTCIDNVAYMYCISSIPVCVHVVYIIL